MLGNLIRGEFWKRKKSEEIFDYIAEWVDIGREISAQDRNKYAEMYCKHWGIIHKYDYAQKRQVIEEYVKMGREADGY